MLEARLRAYFYGPHVAVAWHAVRDCLTVRYNKAIGSPSDRWKRVCHENSKGYHSRYHTGLTEEMLESPDMLYQAYDYHLKTTAKLVFACPLAPRRISRRASRAITRALEHAREVGFDYEEPATDIADIRFEADMKVGGRYLAGHRRE